MARLRQTLSTSDGAQEPQAARNQRVRKLEVFPADVTAQLGQSVSLLAIPRDDDNSPVGGVWVNWRAEDVDNQQDIPMDPSGRFIANFPGTYRVVAEALGLQASSTIVVGESVPSGFIEPPDLFDPSWRYLSRETPTSVVNRRGRQPLNEEATPPPPGVPSSVRLQGSGQGNFRLDAPPLQLSGRGLGVSLNLTYNSRVWTLDSVNHKITYDADAEFPAPGWSLGFGKLLLLTPETMMLVDGDGTRHGIVGERGGDGFEGYTVDGSFIDCVAQFNGTVLRNAKIQYHNGTEVAFDVLGPGGLYPSSITDANGNNLRIAYSENGPPKIRYIQDTLGRIVTFYYDYPDGTPLLTAITAPGLRGGQRTVARFHYRQVPLNYAFDASLTSSVRRTAAPWLMDAIFYPGTSSGYWFGDFDSFSSYGMLTKVIEQRDMRFTPGQTFDQMGTVAAGTMTHERRYDYPVGPVPGLTDAPTYSAVSDSWAYINGDPVVTRYLVRFDQSPRTVDITYPNGTHEIQRLFNAPGEFTDGLVYEQEVQDRSGARLRLRRTGWEQGEYGSPRIASIELTDERGQSTRTGYRYWYFELPQEINEYDYNQSLSVFRTTRIIYETNPAYHDRRIYNLRKRVEVYDQADRLQSRTDYSYDDFPVAATPGVVQHSPAGAFRGNLTKIISYANAVSATEPITQTRSYDETGNVIRQSSSCCEETSFEYTAATQYAYPTKVTRGAASEDPSSRVATNATYDFNTGLPLSSRDANERTTNFDYSPASLRLETTTLSTNASIVFLYSDTDLSVLETQRTAAGDIARQAVTRLNGRKLPRRQETLAEGVTWNWVDYEYNEMGQPWKQSRPYQSGQSPQWTENSYDDLGRLSQIQLPEGSTVRQYYNEPRRPEPASDLPGQTVRSQDAWGREKWIRTDAFGRLVEVVEPNPTGEGSVFAPGALATTYQYNGLDKLVEVRQGAQRRLFNYDSLGRLTHQKLAERSGTLDDSGAYAGAGGVWSDRFRYDERSNLISHVDARGVKTVYDYRGDPLNRLHEISYDTSGFGDTDNSIAPSPNITYEYMPSGDVSRLLRVTASGVATEDYGYDGEGRVNSKTVRLAGREGYPHVTEYIYDTLSRVTDATYPRQYGFSSEARKRVHYDYDAASRLTTLQVDGVNYASQLVYNPASQVTSMKVGASGANQITEEYSFEAATGFLNNQKARRGGASLLDLSYSYLRAGATIGRTGQLTTLVNNLNHNRDKNYLYDALGRLAEVSGGPYSTPFWAVDYGYDRYGNRTRVTPSGYTVGGAQPDSVEPNEPSGPPSFPDGPSGGLSPHGNGAEFVSQSVPTFILQGRLYEVSITMRNTGDTDWEPQTYRLGSQNPPDNRIWGVDRISTPTWVYAGRQAVFHQSVRPPDAEGTYNFQWQMIQEGVEWFGSLTPNVSVQVVPPGPLPPTDLRLRVVSSTAIDLQWTPNSTDEDEFRIQRKRGLGGTYEQIARVDRGVTTYSDRDLEPGTTYYYRVQAHNSVGSSPFSNEASAATWASVPTDGHPSLSYDAQTNRINTAGFAYDASGNQVRALRADGAWQRYQYDAAGRLVRVKDDAGVTLELYTYGAGRQRLKTQYGETSNMRTYYAWEGNSVVAEFSETDAIPNFPAWSKSYLYMGARLLATFGPNDSQERVQYHHPDRLGTRLVTDPATGEYFEQTTLPFGVPLPAESTGSTNQRFTSYDRSSVTGLDYAINRHYDAQQGRFMQVDPLGIAAVALPSPQSLNLYAYTANDPVNKADSAGLDWVMVMQEWSQLYLGYGDPPGHDGLHWHQWTTVGWIWQSEPGGFPGGDFGGSGGGGGSGSDRDSTSDADKAKKKSPKPCGTSGTGFGVGIVGSGAGELGYGAAGLSLQGGVGGGFFYDSATGPSVGGFAEGAVAGNLFNYVGGVPTQTSQPIIAGAYAGGGGGIFFTNARSAQQLRGPFQTISINIGVGPAKFSVQVSFSGHIWGASITVGPGAIVSGSRITTTTATTPTGCK